MKLTRFIAAKLLLVLVGLSSFAAVQAQGLEFQPGSLNFTNTVPGSTSTEQTVSAQFVPSPPSAMNLTVVSVGPPSNPAFSVTSNTCPVGAYAQYATCEIKFTFTAPPAAGPVSAVFSFVTNELGSLNISLNGNSDGVAPQVITFTSTAPSGATVGGTYEVSATGGGSGNPVVFSIDPSSTGICSVAGSTVSFLTPGNCMVNANQAGGPAFEVAPQQSQSFAVAAAPLTPQAIVFTSVAPEPATVGGTYAIAATGGASGNPVTFTIDPASSAMCTLSGSTVSFTAPGSCMVLANQAGNTGFEPAPQVNQSFAITAVPVTPPSATATPVPTLSQWSLMLLASLLGGLAFWRQRRKS